MTESEEGTVGGIAEAHLVAPPDHAVTASSVARANASDSDPPAAAAAAADSPVARMPVLAADAPPLARANPPTRILWPTETDAEEEELPDPAPPKRTLPAPWLRAAYAAAALVGAFGAFALLGPRRSASAPVDGAAGEGLPVEVRLDARVDTLARALATFDLRAQLFEARQMTCEDLARGLVQIDDQWIAYNAVRKVAPATLDSVRTAHDGAAQANVRAAERRFERSGCARP